MPLLLASAGCATQTVPVTDLRPFKPIVWSCETAKGAAREGIIKHNSVLASLRSGKRIVYADDCPGEVKSKPTT